MTELLRKQWAGKGVYVSTNILPADQVELIFALGISHEKDGARRHFAASPIKILYNIYQYTKTYVSVYPGAKKQAVAKSVNLSTKSIYRFVNDKRFNIFGIKINRENDSNEYKLHPWVIECFQNLERLGFMKFFATDFKKWLRLWRLQIPRFIMNKLMNISTWANLRDKKRNLSTKTGDRCPRGGEINVPLQGSTISSQGSLENGIREAINPFSAKHEEMVDSLEKEFGMKEGDIYYVTNYLGLRDMQGGISILRQRVQKGWRIQSPIKSFMHSVNTFKKLRKSAGQKNS